MILIVFVLMLVLTSIFFSKSNEIRINNLPETQMKTSFFESYNIPNDAIIDKKGNTWIVGSTDSIDFPLINEFQSTLAGYQDGFITEIDSNGKIILSTYFGGSETDDIRNIAIDSKGNIILIGNTESPNFPVKNGFDMSFNSENAYNDRKDVFITKLAPNGTILWSTYLGGSLTDYTLFSEILSDSHQKSVLINSDDSIVVCGFTYSSNFPTTSHAIKQNHVKNDLDLFISKFNTNGSLQWSTSLGYDNDIDYMGYFTSDLTNNIFINIQSPNATRIIKITSDGYLAWERAFITENSSSFVMKTDNNGDLLIVSGIDNKTITKMSINSDNTDILISKINGSDGMTIWETQLGGASSEPIFDLFVSINSKNELIIAGKTYSDDFPVINGFKFLNSDLDYIFVLKLDRNGKIVWSSVFNGDFQDYLTSQIIDDNDNIYLAGHTPSTNLIPGPYSSTFLGWEDGFILKLFDNGSINNFSYVGQEYRNYYKILLNNGDNLLFIGANSGSGTKEDENYAWYNVIVTKLNDSNLLSIWTLKFGGTDNKNPYTTPLSFSIFDYSPILLLSTYRFSKERRKKRS